MTDCATVHFDADMLARYGQAGPRYTSYPTALQFTHKIEPHQYSLAAASSDDALQRRPLSLYVHIPFCFSPCLYCGCNKTVTRDTRRVESYARSLMKEISMRGRYFDRRRMVEQMHFGGGTPTYLPTKLLVDLVARIALDFQLTDSKDRDYSIEIDPRSVDHGRLRLLAELGFNRVSLGVQDFDPAVQKAVNRVQPVDMVESVYRGARALGFRSINFDLIYGLPLQTLDTFAATLDRVIDMRPDRLAVNGYAHMPQLFKAQRHIRQDELPTSGIRIALLQLAVAKLTAAGYLYIGLDHFALPTDGLAQAKMDKTLHRSFQGYATHSNRDLVSFGVSAIGDVGLLYVQNSKVLTEYEAAIDCGELPPQFGIALDGDDQIRRDVIQQIMCHGLLNVSAVEERHNIVFEDYFRHELQRLRTLQDDGLVVRTAHHLTLTPQGRLLMRAVAMVFDAYESATHRPALTSRMV